MKQSAISNKSQNILDQFKDPALGRTLLDIVRSYKHHVSIMEVCGTHTMAFFRTGLRFGLPGNITLLSGPGCPVCVTPATVLEEAIGLACQEQTMLFVFGDMMKVPGLESSLESAKANRRAHVKIMYSPLEALEYAACNQEKNVVLFGVGFETTIPLFASVLKRAHAQNSTNLFVLPAFKLIPPALKYLASTGNIAIDGFILPGNVSAILGESVYHFLAEEYNVPGVITGFESVDMLEGLVLLLDMITQKKPHIKNQYTRFVLPEGNQKARDVMHSVFETDTAEWRGLGTIPASGLKLRSEFAQFDARQVINFKIPSGTEPAECRCGEVIKGTVMPTQCTLFGKKCTPVHPVGACMVSSEGTCAIYYKYGESRSL